VERLCARLGQTLAEAVGMAEAADQATPVTARCAVFAKSELTHFANQGEPHGRLFRGQFESVAANLHGLFDKIKVAGPTVVVGHGALIGPIASEFARLAGGDVSVPPEAPVFEALGALAFAFGQDWPVGAVWPADPAELTRPPQGRIGSLTAAAEGPGDVVRLPEPADESAEESRGTASHRPAPVAVLGLDLGSTGSKAALVEVGSGRLLADVYRRTDGNPVEAAAALVAQLREMSDATVVAMGITGSGRDAAATVARAAFPDIGSRLCVQNEIVAHATAACRYDPGGGLSLSIVEIGGQDAKFINVRNGRVVDSDMNRVCSAGTGSFLEEQSEAFGVHDIAEFGEQAALSTRPPDLGQTCTVFVGDVAAEALNQGYSRADVFAGLQFSVIRNYRNRVMGQRRFQERIMFQGKPATSASLARTLAAITGRAVCVPPNPGAMGAIGIALLAAQELGADTAEAAGAPLDMERLLRARIEGRREFRCRDRSCGNLCRIESATVAVDGEARTVVSGGTCPKYDVAGTAGGKLPKGAPRPFQEREELLARLTGEVATPETAVEGHAEAASGGETGHRGRPRKGRVAVPDDTAAGPVVGIPYSHYLIDALPFFHAFFTALGARVRVIRSTRASLAEGDRRCAAAGACAPVKIAHALTGAQADVLFLPKLINVPYPGRHWGPSTCPMTQGSPEMIEAALRAEGDLTPVLRPVLFRDGAKGYQSRELAAELAGVGAALAKLLGGAWTPNAFPAAFKAAVQAQRDFEDGLAAIGERALHAAAEAGVPVVLVIGETHVLHEPLLNPGIHDLVAANGAIPLPVDCFAVPRDVPPLARVHWASAGRMLRASLAAARRGDVFPMLVGAYGCGPNSFVEHLFNDLFEEYPHTVLETDGHGGTAGYVTRVQAFLHSVHAYQAERAALGDAGADPVSAARLARYDEPMPHSFDARDHDGPIYFGNAGGSLGRQVAAAMRGRGMDAVAVESSNEDSLRRAGDGCSGKECLPYQLLWGSLARFVEQDGRPDGERALLLSVGNGFRSCRAAVFPLTETIGLERLGVADRITVGDLSMLTDDLSLTPVVWAAIVANDLLLSMRFYHQADEATRGSADALYEHFAGQLESELERHEDGSRADAGGIRRAGGIAADVYNVVGRVQRVVSEAAAGYAALPRRAAAEDSLRDVFLCGDIYLRIDEWGNDDLQRRLADLGLRPIIEPYAGFFELIALRDVQEMPLTDGKGMKRRVTLRFMGVIVSRLLGAAREHQPWLFWNDIHDVEEASREAFDGYPFGESITSIGGALHSWRSRPVDGVVLVLPRGCGPALISEAQLRRASGAPTLYVYNDGDPIDVARLAGFAWRLRSRPARRPAARTAASAGLGVAAR
jgi:activator of 2-hydroxyglutaryl-CoA dehydratase/predicted nucleotide-binding protein (sugar kinase/HSP70/actin superfamily)